jgi:hypothetical protein
MMRWLEYPQKVRSFTLGKYHAELISVDELRERLLSRFAIPTKYDFYLLHSTIVNARRQANSDHPLQWKYTAERELCPGNVRE